MRSVLILLTMTTAGFAAEIGKTPLGQGGKQVAAIQLIPGAEKWQPRVRKSIPAIPGHTRERFTLSPTFVDTLEALEAAGWPAVFTDDKLAANHKSSRDAYRERMKARRDAALAQRRKRAGR